MTGLIDAVVMLHASLTNRIGDRSVVVVRLTHLMLSRNDYMLAYMHNANDIIYHIFDLNSTSRV